MPVEGLPDAILRQGGECGARFKLLGCGTFRDAARYIRDLPYGRNTGVPAYASVLDDARGTCSSKHALIATLANELELDVALMLGVYEMTERNTPGVGRILAEAGLPSIPEAHCWIEFDGIKTDLTSPSAETLLVLREFFHTEPITPQQTGEYKSRLHKAALSSWLQGRKHLDLTPEAAWTVRETCIASLSRRSE